MPKCAETKAIKKSYLKLLLICLSNSFGVARLTVWHMVTNHNKQQRMEGHMAMQLAAEGEQCWLCGNFFWPTTYQPLCAHCTESDFGITAEQVRRVAGAVLGLPKQVWHRVTLEIETTRKSSSNVAGLALESNSYVLACEWPSGRRQVYARYGQSPVDALVKAYQTIKGI